MFENQGNVVTTARPEAMERIFVAKVFTWMTWGLLVTGIVAAAVGYSEAALRVVFGNPVVYIGLVIGELALVWIISSGIGKLSGAAASALFIVFSAVNGLTLSCIFVVYTASSITSTFFVTAGMFGATAAYGYVTKRDLSSIGSFCFMALIGLILASVVNMFLDSPRLTWLITYAGIVIFVGLTAYDMQKIRGMAVVETGGASMAQTAAIVGALALYLDFVNLFLYLLRLMAKRK